VTEETCVIRRKRSRRIVKQHGSETEANGAFHALARNADTLGSGAGKVFQFLRRK
jgi:hypothetical protein